MHSCRSLPLKDSTVALSIGVLWREKSVLIILSYTGNPPLSNGGDKLNQVMR